MIDDHDTCEWVNVSSGTGSPKQSRTKGRETVVVVVVVVVLVFIMLFECLQCFDTVGWVAGKAYSR